MRFSLIAVALASVASSVTFALPPAVTTSVPTHAPAVATIPLISPADLQTKFLNPSNTAYNNLRTAKNSVFSIIGAYNGNPQLAAQYNAEFPDVDIAKIFEAYASINSAMMTLAECIPHYASPGPLKNHV